MQSMGTLCSFAITRKLSLCDGEKLHRSIMGNLPFESASLVALSHLARLPRTSWHMRTYFGFICDNACAKCDFPLPGIPLRTIMNGESSGRERETGWAAPAVDFLSFFRDGTVFQPSPSSSPIVRLISLKLRWLLFGDSATNHFIVESMVVVWWWLVVKINC